MTTTLNKKCSSHINGDLTVADATGTSYVFKSTSTGVELTKPLTLKSQDDKVPLPTLSADQTILYTDSSGKLQAKTGTGTSKQIVQASENGKIDFSYLPITSNLEFVRNVVPKTPTAENDDKLFQSVGTHRVGQYYIVPETMALKLNADTNNTEFFKGDWVLLQNGTGTAAPKWVRIDNSDYLKRTVTNGKVDYSLSDADSFEVMRTGLNVPTFKVGNDGGVFQNARMGTYVFGGDHIFDDKTTDPNGLILVFHIGDGNIRDICGTMEVCMLWQSEVKKTDNTFVKGTAVTCTKFFIEKLGNLPNTYSIGQTDKAGSLIPEPADVTLTHATTGNNLSLTVLCPRPQYTGTDRQSHTFAYTVEVKFALSNHNSCKLFSNNNLVTV